MSIFNVYTIFFLILEKCSSSINLMIDSVPIVLFFLPQEHKWFITWMSIFCSPCQSLFLVPAQVTFLCILKDLIRSILPKTTYLCYLVSLFLFTTFTWILYLLWHFCNFFEFSLVTDNSFIMCTLITAYFPLIFGYFCLIRSCFLEYLCWYQAHVLKFFEENFLRYVCLLSLYIIWFRGP